jgi:hypothetical protein
MQTVLNIIYSTRNPARNLFAHASSLLAAKLSLSHLYHNKITFSAGQNEILKKKCTD